MAQQSGPRPLCVPRQVLPEGQDLRRRVSLRQDFIALCSFSLLPFAAEGGITMKSKPMEDFEMAEHRAKITISRKIKKLHPVVKSIANNH